MIEHYILLRFAAFALILIFTVALVIALWRR